MAPWQGPNERQYPTILPSQEDDSFKENARQEFSKALKKRVSKDQKTLASLKRKLDVLDLDTSNWTSCIEKDDNVVYDCWLEPMTSNSFLFFWLFKYVFYVLEKQIFLILFLFELISMFDIALSEFAAFNSIQINSLCSFNLTHLLDSIVQELPESRWQLCIVILFVQLNLGINSNLWPQKDNN